jgi:hypothetical protein
MKPYIRLGKSTTYATKALNPQRRVVIWQYLGKVTTDSGASKANYNQVAYKATIQVPSVEELQQDYKISIAGVYKSFYFDDSKIVHGLNRNLNIGQDYIQFEDRMYAVEHIGYEALDDFILVIGREDASFTGENPTPKGMSPKVGSNILR